MIKNTIFALIFVCIMYFANLIKAGFEVCCMFYMLLITYMVYDIHNKIIK